MSPWVSFVRSIQGRKFDRIPDKKYGLHRTPPLMSGTKCRPLSSIVLTVLLNTQSKFPSSVFSFMPHPWTSRVVSAEPASGPTVEMRKRTSLFFPIVLRKLAEVMSVQSWVHSNSPYALKCCVRQGQCLSGCHSMGYIPNSLCMDHSTYYPVRNDKTPRGYNRERYSYSPLRNSFTREMRQCLDQLSVLE